MHINQNIFLNWFTIQINLYNSYISKSFLGIESLNLSILSTFRLETLQFTLQGLWSEVQEGICIADLDRILIFVILLRFILLACRYNIITSLVITGTSIFAGYLWYSRFLKLILTYERGLYKIPYTSKLAVDASQIKFLVQGTLKNSDYQMRISNPGGVILYAFGNGSIVQGHRIDPLSMLVSRIPDNFSFKHNFENLYYLMYRKVIPTTFRIFKIFNRQLHAIIIYTVITRINKRYCPYLVRWHWTAYFLIAGTDRILVSLFKRIQYYLVNFILPKLSLLEDTQESTAILKTVKFELAVSEYISLFIITVSLGLTLFLLFHALCGQYIYLPFITENVELHIGTRSKESIYSGGLTAWQDKEEKSKYKFWFGWFGRGTINRKDSFLKKYFYYLYKQIKKIFNF